MTQKVTVSVFQENIGQMKQLAEKYRCRIQLKNTVKNLVEKENQCGHFPENLCQMKQPSEKCRFGIPPRNSAEKYD